jgi:hypothetical protein
MTFDTANLNGAHPRTALGAPASGTAGVEFSQKRAGPEIGAPWLPSESEAVCGCAHFNAFATRAIHVSSFVFVWFVVHPAAVFTLIG